jgi:hypothetical protein
VVAAAAAAGVAAEGDAAETAGSLRFDTLMRSGQGRGSESPHGPGSRRIE